MAHDDAGITVEVAYARPDQQQIIRLQVAPGCTIQDAIEQSGMLDQYPEIQLANNKVGIFGKLNSLQTALREGDRVEIYRPLLADPKAARKKRAAKNKSAART
jgi:putative ubiquitin-RnfH superfamily antitoxin RatB of RatAB toxin-antitoxin module